MILDINEARDDGWQWHQMHHMQIIYISLQIDNHASISPLSFYSWMPSCHPINSVKAVEV